MKNWSEVSPTLLMLLKTAKQPLSYWTMLKTLLSSAYTIIPRLSKRSPL